MFKPTLALFKTRVILSDPLLGCCVDPLRKERNRSDLCLETCVYFMQHQAHTKRMRQENKVGWLKSFRDCAENETAHTCVWVVLAAVVKECADTLVKNLQ